jgi:hypothetical protein
MPSYPILPKGQTGFKFWPYFPTQQSAHFSSAIFISLPSPIYSLIYSSSFLPCFNFSLLLKRNKLGLEFWQTFSPLNNRRIVCGHFFHPNLSHQILHISLPSFGSSSFSRRVHSFPSAGWKWKGRHHPPPRLT